MTDRDWVITTYDDLTAAHADAGAPVDMLRTEFAGRYAEAVASGSIPLDVMDDVEIGFILFDRFVRPERSRRKQSWKRNLGYLNSILRGDEADGSGIDPILDMTFPTGEGFDKTLRLWTREDWQKSITARYRNAAEATSAAAEHDRLVQGILDALDVRHLTFTRDLFAQAVAS